MASLKSLLGTKQDAFVSVAESNLEKGQIFTYHNGANYSRIWCGFCFHPSVSGTAVVEDRKKRVEEKKKYSCKTVN